MFLNKLTNLVLVFWLLGSGLWAQTTKDEKPTTDPTKKDTKPADPTKKDPVPPAQTADQFHSISLNGSGTVVVRQTGKETVKVNGDATPPRIEKGVLHLEGAATFEIEVKELKSIKLNGAGNFELKDLKGKKLTVSINGAGNVTPAGTVEELEVLVDGAGDVKAANLKGRLAIVKVNGAGNAIVNASERLTVDISGAGNVEYIGTPKVEQTINGSGEVRQHVPKDR